MLHQLFFFISAFLDFLSGTIRFSRGPHTRVPLIAVFGSARTASDTPLYQMGIKVGSKLVQAGFGVLTGGGPGMMEAANKGAFESKGVSIACNIQLPHEQKANPYLQFAHTCRYFFTRKYFLFHLPKAFVVLPGGYGTFDELFELLTLIQTQTLTPKKVFLVGTEFWSGLIQWLEHKPLSEKMINQKCLDSFVLTDDLDLVIDQLKQASL